MLVLAIFVGGCGGAKEYSESMFYLRKLFEITIKAPKHEQD